MSKRKTITKKEALRRRREADITDEAPENCECCGKHKPGDIAQDSDYAWVCNFCQWTRTDRIDLENKPVYVAFRNWHKKQQPTFVCTLPGQPDAFGPAPKGDYGYARRDKALLLTQYQAERFLKYMSKVGAQKGTFGVFRPNKACNS